MPDLRLHLLRNLHAGLVKMAGNPGEEDQVIPIHQLDPALFHSIPKLKQQAIQNWCESGREGLGKGDVCNFWLSALPLRPCQVARCKAVGRWLMHGARVFSNADAACTLFAKRAAVLVVAGCWRPCSSADLGTCLDLTMSVPPGMLRRIQAGRSTGRRGSRTGLTQAWAATLA